MRFNAGGTPDGTFGTAGKVLTFMGEKKLATAYDATEQADQKLVVVGESHLNFDGGGAFVMRYNSDGSVDGIWRSGDHEDQG